MTPTTKIKIDSEIVRLLADGFSEQEVLKRLESLKFRKVIFCNIFLRPLQILANLNPQTTVKIGDLDLSTSEYARFNDLCRFGFLSRDSELPNGIYVINHKYIADFLIGDATVAEHYLINPVTKEVKLSDDTSTIGQVRTVNSVKQEFGSKMTEYVSEVENAQG